LVTGFEIQHKADSCDPRFEIQRPLASAKQTLDDSNANDQSRPMHVIEGIQPKRIPNRSGKRDIMKIHAINFSIVAILFLTAPASGQMMGQMMQGGGMMGMSSVRHQYVIRNGVDPKYATKTNPLKPTARNIGDGKRLYEQNCALCHGPAGSGDGEAGKNLSPPPANIAAFSKTRLATDGYLYWSIAEGGVPVATGMPPYKGSLKEDDIWKIVLYLRKL
jgi:mono/diheme cytochrome c family protein